ncbi:hypothetical protein C2G38_2168512 [Gigaspora rosea]|uniref:Uncharacterized protein n=1 Tax=Gigaspora rosea TaxID=44941 RepID=A0A397VU17_9GLOM|nr:hypothetical protein C2G38_2168512 [Gigaspora rosea]
MEVVKLNLKSKENSLILCEVISISFIETVFFTGSLYNKIEENIQDPFALAKIYLILIYLEPKGFYSFMGELKGLIVNAESTAAHCFIKNLADMKKLSRVYTQNIDNLEELVGLDVDWQLKSQAQQSEASNFPECEERENAMIKNKVDDLILLTTETDNNPVRIPCVKGLIKDFASAVYNHKVL